MVRPSRSLSRAAASKEGALAECDPVPVMGTSRCAPVTIRMRFICRLPVRRLAGVCPSA